MTSEIGSLRGLKELVLDGNEFSDLPGEINLNELRALHICRNQLTSLPSEIEKLTCLESLDVRCNCLTSLPQIGRLAKLGTFECDYHLIDELIEYSANSRELVRNVASANLNLVVLP